MTQSEDPDIAGLTFISFSVQRDSPHLLWNFSFTKDEMNKKQLQEAAGWSEPCLHLSRNLFYFTLDTRLCFYPFL